jgi:formate dehydrogenase major subunit
MILWGMGISQHMHGTDNARCLIALCLMTGQIGAGHRPASVARPEQRAGRIRFGPDPDGVSGLSARRQSEALRAFRKLWGARSIPSPV